MALSYVETNGDGVTTNFAIPFSFLDRTHIHVYISDVETLSFTWVNSATIQITPAPPSGTGNILIQRVTPRNAALVDYNNGSVLFDTDLDTTTLQMLFVVQEFYEQAALSNPATDHSLDSHTDTTPSESVAKGSMRVFDYQSMTRAITFTDGGLLIGNTTDNRGVSMLAQGTEGQTLEVSASLRPSWAQGLRKVLTTAGDLLYATGAGIAARLGIGSAGFVLSAGASAPAWECRGFLTGDGKFTWRTAADSGWVLANDGTIGSASSGATNRANADTQALFTLLWDYPDALAPVIDGRGASAAADWAANKQIRLLRVAGRAIAGLGAAVALDAGTEADVSIANDTLTVPTNVNKWITGMPIVITYTGTLTGTGISSGAVLHVIRDSATTIKLATTLANAQNGVAINITAASALAWTITYTDPDTHVGGSHEGEHAHAMTSSQLLLHNHPLSRGNTGSANVSGGGIVAYNAGASTGSEGGNEAMNVVQPTSYWTIQVKL
jgi:hypothetical protein